MRKHKIHGFYINCLFRTLITIFLLTYASGVSRKDRKYRGSSNRIDWWANGYYSSLRDIQLKYVKKKCEKMVAGTGFLEVFKGIRDETRRKEMHYIDRRGGFLVIECMNKTAADELAMLIVANTSAKFIDYPTERVLSVMKRLRLRRNTQLTYALETLSHYDAALQMVDDITWNVFIMSRYWYYSATTSIARSTMGRATVPRPRHAIYSWPKDLLMPDVVLFLKYPIYPIEDDCDCVTKIDCIDLGSRATKAFLRMSYPEVIDVYGDYVYGEIDPYEASMEILRKKYPSLLWPREKSSEYEYSEGLASETVRLITADKKHDTYNSSCNLTYNKDVSISLLP